MLPPNPNYELRHRPRAGSRPRREISNYDKQKPKFLLRHLGNMGDLIFFLPPILVSLKKHHPTCHITVVTAWGYKNKRGKWGQRNQGGHGIHLLLTNPHIGQLIHFHTTKTSLNGQICHEDGHHIPTWSAAHYEAQKNSGDYDNVFELDFGIGITDNPLERLYQAVDLPDETYSNYQIHLTDRDRAIAAEIMADVPHPRIALLESFTGPTTRNWDPGKLATLEQTIKKTYGVPPLWFGARYAPDYHGRPLTLRENIATLTHCDVGIGVLSGPLHFAAAVGLPTLTLYCDQPLHRAAPSYFLNPYISDSKKHHRTLLGPSPTPPQFLKYQSAIPNLTPAETQTQQFKEWLRPGHQATKSCLAVITVDEIMSVLQDMLPREIAQTNSSGVSPSGDSPDV